ncbi:MAG: hypothetical protein KAI61_03585 [Alphaproteobacteria bacterium]|nr:hypothetical protein [Alphaproteobacteria bacterium]MCK5658736.1 hypothetical protein [Alphaproteobacteria bacterium]
MTTKGLEIRTEIDNGTVRGLLLINGGGAVALLAFLPTIINKHGFELLVLGTLVGLLFYQTGLLCAVLHNTLRRKCSLIYEQHNYNPPENKLGFCHWSRGLMWASVVFFYFAGLVVIICGVLSLLTS